MNAEKIEEISDFIHQSMCVEGFVKFDSFLNIERHGNKLRGALFEVTDKKRGLFYISWLYPDGITDEKFTRMNAEESKYGNRKWE